MDVFIDPRFGEEYARQPLVLVDIGARGGVKRDWAPASRHLHVIAFEPDPDEFARLRQQAAGDGTRTLLNTALHERQGRVELFVAREGGLSSVFRPNRSLLDTFPAAARFDTVTTVVVEADTLDHQLRVHGIDDVDFVKVDTQGSELPILRGARETLAGQVAGVEVEVEFAPVYQGQPLFADVDAYLRELGFYLFDLRPCYWKRSAGVDVGGPYGQIIWADALYLRQPASLGALIGSMDAGRRRSKFLRAVSICLLYGYLDYALELTASAGDSLSREDVATIQARVRSFGRDDSRVPDLPGRQVLAGALHRLWKVVAPRRWSWSVSDPELGNRRW